MAVKYKHYKLNSISTPACYVGLVHDFRVQIALTGTGIQSFLPSDRRDASQSCKTVPEAVRDHSTSPPRPLQASSRIANDLAHAAIVPDLPGLAADGISGIEEGAGVILLLDGAEPGVLVAKELLLETGLAEIGLVHVGAGSGGDGLDLGHDLVGHQVLSPDHLFPLAGLK